MPKVVVRVLIPDGGGFITVTWDSNEGEKEDDSKDFAIARDLMKKVLAKYSKRVLGLGEASTPFDARAALDFRTWDGSTELSRKGKDPLDLYRFASIIKDKPHCVFKDTKSLSLLFKENTEDFSNHNMKDSLKISLGLWRSGGLQRRRTVATPRQLELGKRLLKKQPSVGGNTTKSEEISSSLQQKSQPQEVVVAESSSSDSEFSDSSSDPSDIGSVANNYGNQKLESMQPVLSSMARRSTAIGTSDSSSNSSVRLSSSMAEMIEETGIVLDLKTRSMDLTRLLRREKNLGSDKSDKESLDVADDIWGLEFVSPWSSRGGSSPSKKKSIGESSTLPAELRGRAKAIRRASILSSDASFLQNPNPSQQVPSSPQTEGKPTSKRRTKVSKNGSRPRRRMSTLTQSQHHLLDDTVSTVLSQIDGKKGKKSHQAKTDLNGTGRLSKPPGSSTIEPFAGSLQNLLLQPPPEAKSNGKRRILRIQRQIAAAEDFIANLPSVSFDVIKVNKMGRRQRRVIYVTSSHILNTKIFRKKSFSKLKRRSLEDAKDTGEALVHGDQHLKVTKSHHFDDVKHVTLKSHDILLIQYHNDHDFIYKSPVATSILNEIGTRIAVFLATKKKRVQLSIAVSLDKRRSARKRSAHTRSTSGSSNQSHSTGTGHSTTRSLALSGLVETEDEDDDETEMTDEELRPGAVFLENLKMDKVQAAQVRLDVDLLNQEDASVPHRNEHAGVSSATSIQHGRSDSSASIYSEVGPLELSSDLEKSPKDVSRSDSPKLNNERRVNAQERSKRGSNTARGGPSRRASKLARLTGETEEQRIEGVLRKLIFDPSSDVGATRMHFLKNFSNICSSKTSEDAMKHLRFFVDGMQKFIMETHCSSKEQSEIGRMLVDVSFTDDHVDKRSNTSAVLEARSSG